MKSVFRIGLAGMLAWAFCAPVAIGTLVVEGHTATVANGFTGSHPSGSHFHSTTDPSVLSPSNPSITISGVAEVGGFFGDEELQGISEFTLEHGIADTVWLMFDVRDMSDVSLDPIDGLFGQGPLHGFVDVYSYHGDHVESVSDFVVEQDRPSETPLLSIRVAPGLIQADDSFALNVTSLYNDLVEDAEPALGVRLLMREVDKDAGAITFDNFRLQITTATAVPEPSPVLCLGFVCLMLSGLSRSRYRSSVLESN